MLFLLTTHITSIKFYFIGNLVYISQYFENLQFEVFPLVCCAASLCSNLKLGNCCRLSASGKLPNIKQKRSLKKEEENIWSAKNCQLQANSEISNWNDLLEHICCNITIFEYQQNRCTNLRITITNELDPFHKFSKSVKSLLASNEKRGKRNSVVVQSTGPSLVKSNRAGGCSSICTNDCQTTSAFVTQSQFGSVLPIYSLS